MFINRATPLVLALVLLLSGCNYGLRSSGGFPADVRTVFIAPLDNETVKFELTEQLARQLNERLPRALGVQLRGEEAADAVIRGRITQYTDAAQNYRSGDEGGVQVLQHQVSITIAVEIIDVKRNAYIWESNSVRGTGEYRPDTQNDEVARARAIEGLIQQIVDGAQSQW